MAPNLGGPGGPTNQGFGVKSAPGATLGPKWHPGPIQARFFVDLDRFLVDFGTILGRFWGRCWSIFVWLLMDNVTSLTNLTNLTNLTPGTVAGLARRASGSGAPPKGVQLCWIPCQFLPILANLQSTHPAGQLRRPLPGGFFLL